MANLLNIVDFPVPIQVTHDVLGTRWRLQLGNHAVELCLPTAQYRSADDQIVYGPPQVRGARFVTRWMSKWAHEPGDIEWATMGGGIAGDLTSRVTSLRSGVVRVSISAQSTKAERQRITKPLAQGMADWYTRFADWIEVLTEQDLDWRHPIGHSITGSRMVRSQYWAQPVAGHFTLLSPQAVHVTLTESGGQPADRVAWAEAARGAAIDRPPPDAWLLLRDARNALHREMYRRSVLDCATAAELVLARAIATHLDRTKPDAIVTYATDQAREMGRKANLAKKLGLAVTSDVEVNLIEVRNYAIHGGSPLTSTQARKAYRAASAIVSTHLPLAAPHP